MAVTAATAQLAARSAKYEAKPGRLSWDGTLHAERHQLVAGDTRIEHASLDWAGATRFDFAAAAASFLHAEGKAAAAGTRIAVGPLALEAERMTAEGVFQHARPDGMLPPLAGRMDAALDNVWVREPGLDWMRASHVQVGDLRLTPGANASLGRLEAQGLAVLARPGKGGFPWRLEARQAVMERATLAGDGTSSFGSVALAGARARATRTKDGFLGLPETTNEAAPDSARPRMILRRLHLGGDSRIDFVDRSLSEPVRLTLEGVEVDMSDLDSFRPDHDSPFTAKARIGAAQLSAQGRARPFAALVGGEMKGTVRALELPPLSPYAADTMGVHLQTGQLDAELALSITQGKLDGGMQLVLNELFVAQPDPNAPLAKSADMPVETVLDLLRDSDNRIRLSIPVRGDLANPDFDVSDAVGQAVGGALRSTVFTTLKVAFPLAGLISLVIDDSESRRLALEPLGFAPGSETLGAAETKRLDAVAALMAQRPTLKLTLCGVATQEGDGPALAERRRLEELGLLARLQNMVGAAPNPRALPVDAAQLTRLADARALAAKTFLVEQRNVDPGRLFVCRPRVEADAKALPRVDLVL
ncbi:MAG: DUF748 domain-containing protein [Magnetospirillum sp.]|nr:DUF748 domain-containing protein [Magnetospirillum sp.]